MRATQYEASGEERREENGSWLGEDLVFTNSIN